MSGDAHLGFIVAAYGVTAVMLGITTVALILDWRAQKRLLARLSRTAADEP